MMTKITKEMTSFAKEVARLGGRAFLVGGAVRDAVMGRPVHDHDFVVAGLKVDAFKRHFGNPKLTGNLFPVFRLRMGDEECEVAFARKERKTGTGHNGFEMVFDETVTIEEDLFRRDLTVNAVAMDVLTGEVVDPFDGIADIKAGVLRAVSEHFIEDPLRVLRVARMAAVFGFDVEEETMRLMEQCHDEISTLPAERIWREMEKALKATRPSVFFRVLKESNTLDVVLPEVHALVGQEQPVQFHPEGDAFEHTMLVLDEVASHTDDIVARFCGLFHDVGKGLTPKSELPRHFFHAQNGARLINGWKNGRFPARFKKAARVVAEQHMKAIELPKMRPGSVLNLLLAVKTELAAFRLVVEADTHQHFDELSDEFVAKVFGKVVIPETFDSAKDGKKIAAFIRQERVRRIRQVNLPRL